MPRLYFLFWCEIQNIYRTRWLLGLLVSCCSPLLFYYTYVCWGICFIKNKKIYLMSPNFLAQLLHTEYARPVFRTWTIIPSIRSFVGWKGSISLLHPVISQFVIFNTSLKYYIGNAPLPIIVFFNQFFLIFRMPECKSHMVYTMHSGKPCFKCRIVHLFLFISIWFTAHIFISYDEGCVMKFTVEIGMWNIFLFLGRWFKFEG